MNSPGCFKKVLVSTVAICTFIAFAACDSPSDEDGQNTTDEPGDTAALSLPGCADLAGSHIVKTECSGNPELWLLIEETSGGCRVRVSAEGTALVERSWDIQNSNLDSEPNDGKQYFKMSPGVEIHIVRSSDWYYDMEFQHLELEVTEDGFVGTGKVICYREGYETDVDAAYTDLEPVTLSPDTGGVFSVEPALAMPWSELSIELSRRADAGTGLFEEPQGFIVFDETPLDPGASLVSMAARFATPWDETRGHTYEVRATDALRDMAGQPFATESVSVAVADIGAAVSAREFDSFDNLFSFGDVCLVGECPYDYSSYLAPLICVDGCVVIRPSMEQCNTPARVAGQMLNPDKDRFVISFADSYGGYPQYYDEIVVAADGTRLSVLPDEGAPLEHVYDVTGIERIGFEVLLYSTCHMPTFDGSPVLIDSMSFR